MNFRSSAFIHFNNQSIFLEKIIKCSLRILFSAFLVSTLSAAEHNFYIGANVGISGFSAKTTDEINNEPPAFVFKKLYTDKSIRSRGTLGGAYIGYILRLQNFGIGTEVSWQYTNLEKTLDGRFDDAGNGDHLQFIIKNKLTSQMEFIIKPGYFICDYFTYAILGINLQNMRYEYNATGEIAGGGTVENFSDRKTKYVRGYTFGVGVQKNIYENIALGLEFKFSKYPERNYKFNFGDPKITISSKLKDIQTYSASLRFMYTF